MIRTRTMVRASGICALVAVVHCSSGSEPGLSLGEIRGTWAGQAWVGDVSATLVEYTGVPDTLFIVASRPRGAISSATESVALHVPVVGTGPYTLAPGAARLFELTGGDVVAATYVGTGGQLTINSSSGVGGVIEGVFSFDATSSDANRSYGESERFENGRFRATFEAGNPGPMASAPNLIRGSR
jgi:hypothetical protein